MTNVNQLATYIQNDLNILISGLPGTGKTAMLKQACAQLGLTMKHYNAATLDPFTDLIGLPVPNQETKTTEYFRPRTIDEAEVIFMDELNRADPRTLNAIFELVQFRSINGTPLPKLRVVVAAMNPPGGDFNVDELDPALVDRFDIFLESTPDFDFRYFAGRFGAEVAKASRGWWQDQFNAYKSASKRTDNNAIYISPRRMELVVNAYLKVQSPSTVRYSLPVGATGANELARLLSEAVQASTKAAPPVAGDFGFLLTLNPAQLRSSKNTDRIKAAFAGNPKDAPGRQHFLSNMAAALSESMGVDNIFKRFGFVVEEFSDIHIKTMTAQWPTAKLREFWNVHSK